MTAAGAQLPGQPGPATSAAGIAADGSRAVPGGIGDRPVRACWRLG